MKATNIGTLTVAPAQHEGRRSAKQIARASFTKLPLLHDGPMVSSAAKAPKTKREHNSRVRWFQQTIATIDMDDSARKELMARVENITLIDEANVSRTSLLRAIQREVSVINKSGFVPERTIVVAAKMPKRKTKPQKRDVFVALSEFKDRVFDELRKLSDRLFGGLAMPREGFAD